MLQANKACVGEQCSGSLFLLPLLLHEFRWARFCFYCEKKAISDQRLLTASGRRVICEHLISSCGSRRMARLYLWQRKASRSNTHKQACADTWRTSRTLQTSVLQTRLLLHMLLPHVYIIPLICLLTGNVTANKEGEIIGDMFQAQTCSLQKAVRLSLKFKMPQGCAENPALLSLVIIWCGTHFNVQPKHA